MNRSNSKSRFKDSLGWKSQYQPASIKMLGVGTANYSPKKKYKIPDTPSDGIGVGP